MVFIIYGFLKTIFTIILHSMAVLLAKLNVTMINFKGFFFALEIQTRDHCFVIAPLSPEGDEKMASVIWIMYTEFFLIWITNSISTT